MRVGEIRKDYLKLTYAKGETLYILPENLDSLQKYVGPGEKEPKLSRLGGDEWKKSVSRARGCIRPFEDLCRKKRKQGLCVRT